MATLCAIQSPEARAHTIDFLAQHPSAPSYGGGCRLFNANAESAKPKIAREASEMLPNLNPLRRFSKADAPRPAIKLEVASLGILLPRSFVHLLKEVFEERKH